MEALFAIIEIVNILVGVFVAIVIIQFVIGLLFMFNVISPSNDAIRGIYNSLQQLMAPVLDPIRKIMPETGSIDFSPLVLIVGAQILMVVLRALASSLV